MSARARLATSALSLAAIAAIVALLLAGATGGGHAAAVVVAPARACGGGTDAASLAATLAVAAQIKSGEHSGTAVLAARHTIESDRVLAAAVAAGDLATVRSEVTAIVFNHQHIVRLRILRGGVVVDDLGGPDVLAPVGGSLRSGGRVVGRFLMSIQDDAGYMKLAHRLAGAHTVVRYHGATIMRDIGVSAATALPVRGQITLGTTTYLVGSIDIGRFPVGTLRISLLVRRPPAALARVSCALVRAEVLAGVAERAYVESRSGSNVLNALGVIARASALRAALASGDLATAAQLVRTMATGGGFGALRVLTVSGHLVADVSPSRPLVAPLSRPLLDTGGQLVGTAVLAVQSARGYADLVHALTQAQVVVRRGSRVLAETFTPPATIPDGGLISWQGVRYAVASFAGEQYPNRPIRIYVLAPG